MPKKIKIEIKESIEFLEREILKSEKLLESLKSEESIKSLETEEKLKRDKNKSLLHLEEGQFHFQRDITVLQKEILKSEKLLKSLETEESLKSLKTKEELKRDRNQTLLCIIEGKFPFQSDIVDKVGRTEKTIRSWIQEYSKNGYRGLLKEKRGGNNTRTISNEAIKHASKFSNEISIIKDMFEDDQVNLDYGWSSFIEVKLQFEKKLGEKIEYHALYSHFRRNHEIEFNFLKYFFSEKRKAKKS